MTLRNAGMMRKLPDDDDLYLTIDGDLLVLIGEKIPRLLSGYSQPLYLLRKSAGNIKLWKRFGYEDIIEIEYNGLTFGIRKDRFMAVWSESIKYCSISERVPDCWQGWQEVTA